VNEVAMDVTDWLIDEALVLFGRYSFRFSVGKLAMLADVLCDFSWSLQANSEIILQFCHDRFLPSPFQFMFPYHYALYSLGIEYNPCTHVF
jgi:hypothetical protein